jgi:uncharacterized protein YbbK (DUF523 family)/uncharacterized protein YbgA (DUF1722 family)
MAEFAKPGIVVSRCLEFDSCRYNGLTISCPAVKKLMPHVEFLPVCPEVEIGLGVPRDPIRLVRRNEDDEPSLIQSSTGLDLTAKMLDFARRFLEPLQGRVQGFILKSRSPSCGMHDTKVYSGIEKGSQRTGRTAGLFGASVLRTFPDSALINEGRLLNFSLREAWFTSVFTMAGFERARAASLEKGRSGPLVSFHASAKLLLLACGRVHLTRLGRIVANHDGKPLAAILDTYGRALAKALGRPPRKGANIDVLLHAMGHFKKLVASREKAWFLDALEEYRAGQLPLSACTSIISSWAVRFENDYLGSQLYLSPYPRDLMEISDSGKGRSGA